MQRKDYIAGVALPGDMKDNFEKIAKAYGMSLSNLFRVSVIFYAGLSMDFKDSMQRIADNLHVQPTFAIERLALAHLAEMAADEEIAGGPIPRALQEFAPGQTANQFYDAWKERKVKFSQADQRLADRMTELNKYKLPGEQAVYPSELQRRKDLAELTKQFPDKAGIFERADAKQREFDAKTGVKRKPK